MHELFLVGIQAHTKKSGQLPLRPFFSFVVVAVVLYVMTILPQSMIVVVVFSQSTKNDTKNC